MTRMTKKDWALTTLVNAPPDAELPPWMRPEIKERAKPRRLEDDLQKLCHEYLDALHILHWSTPNHIYRGKKNSREEGAFYGYMKREKAKGLRKGVSDLCVLFRNRHGAMTLVFAELKIGYNKPDPDQQAFLDEANRLGAFTGVVRSLEDLQGLLRVAGHGAVSS